MFRRVFLAVPAVLIAATLSTTAFAGSSRGHGGSTPNPGSSASASATAKANASASSSSTSSNRNVNRAAASIGGAGLAAADGTCQGSFYLNAVGGIAGLGFGKTYDVTFCKKIQQAEAMRRFGYNSVALRILLQDPDIAKAWNATYEANQRNR